MSGVCKPTPQGPRCLCTDGHELVEEEGGSVICKDVDECANYRTCAQTCTNTKVVLATWF